MDWDYLIKIARDENNNTNTFVNNMGINPNSTRANNHHHNHHNK